MDFCCWNQWWWHCLSEHWSCRFLQVPSWSVSRPKSSSNRDHSSEDDAGFWPAASQQNGSFKPQKVAVPSHHHTSKNLFFLFFFFLLCKEEDMALKEEQEEGSLLQTPWGCLFVCLAWPDCGSWLAKTVIYRLQEAAVVEAAAQRITSQLQAISVTETTILRTIQGNHHLSWCVIPCYDKMHSFVNR